MLAAQQTDDVFFAYFPRPDRRPYLMRSFQAVWNDATLQAFMLAHGIQPGNCSISWDLTPDAEEFNLWCSKDGYELQAQVDGLDFVLASSSTTNP
jgi:hypothetical protein